MSTISDSARVLANGAEIILKDGSAHRLIFDFEAIAMVEEEHGSLEEFAEALQGKKRFSAIKNAMVAALVHTDMTPKEIVRLLEFKRFEQYLEALTDAFYEAMPEGMAATTTPLALKRERRHPGSRGNGSTGASRSTSTAPMKSSSG